MKSDFKSLILFSICILSNWFANAANFYWVNGSGKWSDYTNHWASTSGGNAYYHREPDNSDNVIFDANSFTQPNDTLHIDPQYIRSADFDCSQVTNFPVIVEDTSNHEFYLKGSLRLSSQMHFNYSKIIFFYTDTVSGTYDIDLAGDSLLCTLVLEGYGGNVFQFQSEFIARSIYFRRGIINTNNHNMHLSLFSSTGVYGPQIFNLGTSTIYLRPVNPPYNVAWYAFKDLTLNNSSSKFYAYNTGNSMLDFADYDHVYPFISITGSSSLTFDSSVVAHIELFSNGWYGTFKSCKIDSVFVNSTIGHGLLNASCDVDSFRLNYLETVQPLSIDLEAYQPGTVNIGKIVSYDSLEIIQHDNPVSLSSGIDSLISLGYLSFKNDFPDPYQSDSIHINYCSAIRNANFGTSNYYGTLQLTAANTYLFKSGRTNYIDTLLAVGWNGNMIDIMSDSMLAGSSIILGKEFCGDFLNIRDMNASGSFAYAGSNSVNISNNSGWIFSSCLPTIIDNNIESGKYYIRDNKFFFTNPIHDEIKIQILDLYGREIQILNASNDFSIDTEKYKTGIYLFRLLRSDQSKYSQFQKILITQHAFD